MQRDMATCPKVNMDCGRKRIPSLLDSGYSHMTELLWEGDHAPHCTIKQGKAGAHQLFQLIAANNGKLPVSLYVKWDLDFLWIKVPKVGILITQEPTKLLDECHKTKFPCIIVWNLNKLAYQMFSQKYGQQNFDTFDCPTCFRPLLFSQPCVFHHNKASGIQSDNITINTTGQQQQSKKAKQFSINEDGLLGKVWIGNTNQPICVPGNIALTIWGRLGKNTKIPSLTPYLLDTAAVHNFPQGISVNCCLAQPKGNAVPVIVMNQKQSQCLGPATIVDTRNVLGRTSLMRLWGIVPSREAENRGGISAITNGLHNGFNTNDSQ